MTPEQADANLAECDARFDAWAKETGVRDSIEMLTNMTRSIAGRRLSARGGAELKMLILRQRDLFKRLVSQAYVEGLVSAEADLTAARAEIDALKAQATTRVTIDKVFNDALAHDRDAARAEIERLTAGINRIAKQPLTKEYVERGDALDELDLEAGYDHCVLAARALLGEQGK